MDELTTTGISYVSELKDGEINNFEINPEDLGLEKISISEIKGGDVRFNSKALRDLLNNTGNKAYKDIVLLNSSAALLIAGKAEDLKQGIEIAREAIESSKAMQTLKSLIEVSNSVITVEEN